MGTEIPGGCGGDPEGINLYLAVHCHIRKRGTGVDRHPRSFRELERERYACAILNATLSPRQKGPAFRWAAISTLYCCFANTVIVVCSTADPSHRQLLCASVCVSVTSRGQFFYHQPSECHVPFHWFSTGFKD